MRGKLVMVEEEEDTQVTRRPEWLRALGSGVKWGIDPLAVSIQATPHPLLIHTLGVPLGEAGGGRGGSQSSPSPRVALGGAGDVRDFPLADPGNAGGARHLRDAGAPSAVLGSRVCASGLYLVYRWKGGCSSLFPAVLEGGAVAVVDVDGARRPSTVWSRADRGLREVVAADGGAGPEVGVGCSSLFPVRFDGSAVRMGRRRTRSLLAAAVRTEQEEGGSCCGTGPSERLGSLSVLDLRPGRWMVLPARFGGSVWLRVDERRSGVLREGLERMRAQCPPPRSGIIRSVKS